ncbi:MAG: hypothetical protein JWM68_2561, partial [Verrucomicrobiales bacterium]|nr:hypothetical protein [Verrucomicrobiales bacterium]
MLVPGKIAAGNRVKSVVPSFSVAGKRGTSVVRQKIPTENWRTTRCTSENRFGKLGYKLCTVKKRSRKQGTTRCTPIFRRVRATYHALYPLFWLDLTTFAVVP